MHQCVPQQAGTKNPLSIDITRIMVHKVSYYNAQTSCGINKMHNPEHHGLLQGIESLKGLVH
jgi:hypothetical protein